jgi:IS30 family transposase
VRVRTKFSALERRAALGMGLATRDQLIEVPGLLPATLRRTLTWDRGSEMAMHAEVTPR